MKMELRKMRGMKYLYGHSLSQQISQQTRSGANRGLKPRNYGGAS